MSTWMENLTLTYLLINIAADGKDMPVKFAVVQSKACKELGE